MGRRRHARHKQKADTSGVKLTVTKKRGRTVVTPELRQRKSIEAMQQELTRLEEAKADLDGVKKRQRRAPAPIPKRKELDYLPVDAGERVDRTGRQERREAKRAEKESRRARREELREKRRLRGGQEVDLLSALGDGFFAAGAEAAGAAAAGAAAAGAEAAGAAAAAAE